MHIAVIKYFGNRLLCHKSTKCSHMLPADTLHFKCFDQSDCVECSINVINFVKSF